MKQTRTNPRAFTLIELLVVLGLVAVLAAMLLPAMAATRLRSHVAGCLDNQRQLAMGWAMYSGDSLEQLVGMGDGVSSSGGHNYVFTWFVRPDNLPSIPGFIYPTLPPGAGSREANLRYDEEGYKRGLIYRYAQNQRIIHCPADSRNTSSNLQYAYRSYSGCTGLNGLGSFNPAGWQLKKTTELVHPSARWIWIEENDPRAVTANTYNVFENLGAWDVNPGVNLNPSPGPNKWSQAFWWDTPSVYHFDSAVFSFADGHAASHRWQDQATVWIGAYNKTFPGKATVAVDIKGDGTTGSGAAAEGCPAGGSPNDIPYVFEGLPTVYNP